MLISKESNNIDNGIDWINEIEEKIFELKFWFSKIIRDNSLFYIYFCNSNILIRIENSVVSQEEIIKIGYL